MAPLFIWKLRNQTPIGFRNSHRRCSMKKLFLKNLVTFTEKCLCWSVFSIKLKLLKIEMIFLEKFDYQKFYISNKIGEPAEVCTSRFWVAQVDVIQRYWGDILFLIEYMLWLLILCYFKKRAILFSHVWVEFQEYDIRIKSHVPVAGSWNYLVKTHRRIHIGK